MSPEELTLEILKTGRLDVDLEHPSVTSASGVIYRTQDNGIKVSTWDAKYPQTYEWRPESPFAQAVIYAMEH